MHEHEGTPTIEELLAQAEETADPAGQAEQLYRCAALYEGDGQPDHAFLVRCIAYRLSPGPDARPDLERLASLTGRLGELDALLAETTPTLPLGERAEAWRDLGRLRLRKLRAADRALEALEVALALGDRGESELLRADALGELGRHAELASVLTGLAAAAPIVEEAMPLLVRLADVLERGVGDALAAEEACRRALALDGSSVAARTRLERLVRTRGDKVALLALVEERLTAADDDDARDVPLREAAELCEELGRLADAAEMWEQLRTRHAGDLKPLRALERIYGNLGRLRAQVGVLEELAGLVESMRERADLHRRLATAWTELGDRGNAIQSLEWLVVSERSDKNFRVLEEQYRADCRYGALADAYAQHLIEAPVLQRRQLAAELACLYERELRDPGQAIGCWQQILDGDSRDSEALEALARLYRVVEDYDSAGVMIERWALLAGDGRERALRLGRAAASASSRKEDKARAHQLWERAHEADPTCLVARLGLAASCRERGDLGRCGELLEGALAGEQANDLALWIEVAALREARGDLEGALAQHRKVLERAPDAAVARRRACQLALQLGHHTEALELASRLPDEGPIDLRVERWLAVARAAQATGDRALAYDAGARAGALAPIRADVLRLRAEQLLAAGKRAEAEAIVATLEEQRATLSIFERTAVAFLAAECARIAGDRETALGRYHEAVGLDPTHRQALRNALDVSVELGRWRDSLLMLDMLSAIERDNRLRGRYRHLAGHVCEDKLADDSEALAYYRAALNDDPTATRTAERIEALLRKRLDFAGLAEHCARSLEHLGDGGSDDGRRARLWCVLADAASGLDDRDGTIAALEVVAKLDRNHYEARRRLSALYLQAGPDALDKSIVAQHELLRLDKGHLPSYHTLANLYDRIGDLARAAACERAAALLTEETAAAARAATFGEPELASRALSAAEWALVRHPDEDRWLSALSSLVAPLLASTAALPLDRDKRYQPVGRDHARPFVRAVGVAARVLDVPVPELFVADDQMAPVRFVYGALKNAVRPVFLVGVPMLGDRRRMTDLVPAVALEAAQLRPERCMRVLMHDPAVLALVIRAVMAVAHDETPSTEARLTAAALKHRLTPVALDQLGVIGRRLREDQRDPARRAAEWLRAADLTAARAALAVTGDLPRTMDAVEARASGPAAARDAIRELVWASITDELWTVRKQLWTAESRPAPTAAAAVV